MSPDSLLTRTRKGNEEISERRHHLAPVLRHALILVEGTARMGDLLAKGERVPNFEASLQALLEQGYVEIAGSAKGRLVELANRLLGKNAGKVVAKLEESADSTESLKAAVESATKLIRLTIDEGKAAEFSASAKDILG